MLSIQGSPDLRRIVVLNPKGGVGKSTLTTNLAGYFAGTGRNVAIVDMDKQGSSTYWLSKRPAELPVIYGVFAAPEQAEIPDDFSITLPSEIDLVIVDTPAGIPKDDLYKFTAGSHAIIVPVMPSEFDIHVVSRLIGDLLVLARANRENRRLGVLATRVKERTVAFRQLRKFLNRLSIPAIGVIRDSQNYVGAAREGISIYELPKSRVKKDLKQEESVIEWLEQRLATPLNERDLLRPPPRANVVRQSHRPYRKLAMLTILALLTASGLSWYFYHKPGTGPAKVTSGILEDSKEQNIPAADLEIPPLSEEEIAISNKLVEPTAPDQSVGDANKNVERDPQILRSPKVASTISESKPENEIAEIELIKKEQSLSPSDKFIQKWRLSGVAVTDGKPVVMLTRSSGSTTKLVSGNDRIDGWRIKEAASNLAVFEKNGEEARLKISGQNK